MHRIELKSSSIHQRKERIKITPLVYTGLTYIDHLVNLELAPVSGKQNTFVFGVETNKFRLNQAFTLTVQTMFICV